MSNLPEGIFQVGRLLHEGPHNLDIEIRALRKGWDEWCEDYLALDERCRKLEAALRKYGAHHHYPQCTIKCDCGLADILATPDTEGKPGA